MTIKLKIYEVARDLGMDNKALVSLLKSNGVDGIKNHMSAVSADVIDQIKRRLNKKSVPVVEERIQAAVIKRRKAGEREPESSIPKEPLGDAHQGDPVVVIPWDVVDLNDKTRARAGFDQYLIEFTGKDREVEKLLVRREGAWADVRYVVQLNGRMRTKRELSKEEATVANSMIRAAERCLEASRRHDGLEKAERVEYVASSQPDGATKITLYLTPPNGKRHKVGLVRVAVERRAHQRKGHSRRVKTRDGQKTRWIKPVWVKGTRVVPEQRYTARREKGERPTV